MANPQLHQTIGFGQLQQHHTRLILRSHQKFLAIIDQRCHVVFQCQLHQLDGNGICKKKCENIRNYFFRWLAMCGKNLQKKNFFLIPCFNLFQY